MVTLVHRVLQPGGPKLDSVHASRASIFAREKEHAFQRREPVTWRLVKELPLYLETNDPQIHVNTRGIIEFDFSHL